MPSPCSAIVALVKQAGGVTAAARLLCVSHGHVSMIVRGQRVPSPALAELARLKLAELTTPDHA